MAGESLFTFNPIGLFLFGIGKMFGGSHAKEREQLFARHRARNEARGWTLGDNQRVFRSAQPVADDTVNRPEFPPSWVATARRRGPRKKKVGNEARVLTNGTQRAWEEAARSKAARTRYRRAPQRRDIPRPSSRSVPIATGSLAFGVNYLAGAIYDRASRQLEDAWRRRQQLLATNRRGAAASRPLVNSQPGATNRTGAQSTRVLSPAPEPAPQPRAQPQHADSRAVSPQPRNAPAPRQAPAPRTSAPPVPRAVAVPRRSLLEWLVPSFPWSAPGVGARVVPPVPASVAQDFSQPSRLTSLNPLLLQSQQINPAPQEQLDKCKCPKPRKKTDKKPCRNPVISRKRDGDVLTTKVRLTCPQSKLKSLSPRTRRTTTSFPGLPSSIPGAGIFSPWG